MKKRLRLNLQFFGEGETGTSAGTEGTDDNNEGIEGTEGTESNQEGTVFTPEQQAVFDAKFKKEMERRTKEIRTQLEDQQKEAEKLRKMNAQQKQEYELEKANKERDEALAKLDSYKMRSEVSTTLSEAGFKANEAILDMVVSDKAETTKASVDAFIQLVNDEVQRQLENKAVQSKVTGNNSTPPEPKESWKKFTHF